MCIVCKICSGDLNGFKSRLMDDQMIISKTSWPGELRRYREQKLPSSFLLYNALPKTGMVWLTVMVVNASNDENVSNIKIGVRRSEFDYFIIFDLF